MTNTEQKKRNIQMGIRLAEMHFNNNNLILTKFKFQFKLLSYEPNFVAREIIFSAKTIIFPLNNNN